MKKFGDKEVYSIHHTGSFGRFYSGASFPIEFVQTSFSVHELSELAFAKDISPDELDFDLLMQRDIDEERVKDKMAPYLDPKNTSSLELRSRVIFFPPLLVAVVPSESEKMLHFYASDHVYKSEEDEDRIVREWPGFFKLEFFESDGLEAYALADCEGDFKVDRDPVKFSMRPVKGHAKGANLVVIDGQHRLCALQQVYAKNPELIKDLVVPVCILFPPNCTTQKAESSVEVRIPKVSEVFRHLFVDVNTNMELVGGHFGILLSDANIGQLVCRKFCETVLSERGAEGLAQIEWNTKKKKDSTIVNRQYSITSIGVLDKALEENFGKVRRKRLALLKYISGIENVETEYDEDNEETVEVEWDRFSLSQKAQIELRAKETLVPALVKIFFESGFYSDRVSIFKEELSRLQDIAGGGGDRAVDAKRALRQIEEYVPIPGDREFQEAKNQYSIFEKNIAKRISEGAPQISGYAIFQRGLVSSWLDFLDIFRGYSVDMLTATDIFIELLAGASKANGIVFSSSQRFMQYSVFSRTKINPKNDTRDALKWLILSFLGNEKVLKSVVGLAPVEDGSKRKELKAKLYELGQDSASKFMNHYKEARMSDFQSSYAVDFDGLDEEQRGRLKILEDEYKEQKRLVRAGNISKAQVSDDFHKAIEAYVKVDVAEAASELKEQLSYKVDILDTDGSEKEE